MWFQCCCLWHRKDEVLNQPACVYYFTVWTITVGGNRPQKVTRPPKKKKKIQQQSETLGFPGGPTHSEIISFNFPICTHVSRFVCLRCFSLYTSLFSGRQCK